VKKEEIEAKMRRLNAEAALEVERKQAARQQALAREEAARQALETAQRRDSDRLAAERPAEAAPRRKADARRRDEDAPSTALEKLHGDLGAEAARGLARRARDELTRKPGENEKSLLLSGALSLFLGPVGWLYAGAWKEAVPATLVYLLGAGLVAKIIPMFLLMPVLLVVMPLSGIAGLVYAWQFNRAGGQRTPLFDKDKDKDKDG
jgi:hypothetical protein